MSRTTTVDNRGALSGPDRRVCGMSTSPAALPLLGLAEELSAAEAHVHDPAAEALLRHLLDRIVDTLVDVAQGHDRSTRTPRPPDLGGLGPADIRSADAASCSSLAGSCHRAAALLERVGAPDRSAGGDRVDGPEQQSRALPLAVRVSQCLRLLAGALQELVQDLPREDAPVMRQRFLRALRRATAHLDGAAP